MSKQMETKMRKLEKDIQTLDKLYEKGEETLLDGEFVSDSDYDGMMETLKNLEEQFPELKSKNSPTVTIPATIVESLEKMEHSTPMLSLEKTTNMDGVASFAQKADSNLVLEEKLDGLTIVLTYQNGKLQNAVTRGDGVIGEAVTHTARTIDSVPETIPFKERLEVRTEALIPYEEFDRINTDGKYSNPRNLASGTIRQLDASIAKKRNLKAIAFDIVYAEGKTFSSTEMISFLKKNGFETVQSFQFKNSKEGLEKLEKKIEEYEQKKRKTLPYMIDGLVIKFNDPKDKLSLGSTSRHPKWAIAYKFMAMESATKLLAIEDAVGKSGQITPVANLKTVNIDGVNITKASLHNYRNVANKDIRIGDEVVVTRANDVIPHIVKSLRELRTGNETVKTAPTHCPVCNSKTVMNGENLFCHGLECTPQIIGKLKHFASRDAMNIDTLGDKMVELLYQENIIKTIPDIYQLKEKEKEICSLEGLGKKKFNNMVNAIEESKKQPFNRVLYGFSIKLIGRSATKSLAKTFESMDSLLESTSSPSFREKILSIPDFGETMTDNLVAFLNDKKNVAMIEELKSLGLSMGNNETVNEQENGQEAVLEGKTFVITGDVEHFKNRKEIQELIESLGGKVSGSVSQKTDFLINNDVNSSSSKNKKAKSLNVPIINEETFLEMIPKQ